MVKLIIIIKKLQQLCTIVSVWLCILTVRPPLQTLGGTEKMHCPSLYLYTILMNARQCFILGNWNTLSPTKRAGLLHLNRVFEPPTGFLPTAQLLVVFYISLGKSVFIVTLGANSLLSDKEKNRFYRFCSFVLFWQRDQLFSTSNCSKKNIFHPE